VLAIYTKSSHEYRLSDPTAVVHSADRLDLNICPHAEDALPRIRRLLNTWKTGFEGKSMFWPFVLNQTMNTDFLIQLQWYTMLTD